MPNPVPLVRLVRSGFVESVHHGSLVILDPSGAVRLALGDVESPVFPRSSNKPFQAAASLAAGAPLSPEELALAAGSHSGEPMHVQRVLARLAASGLTEDDLLCPPDYPLDEAARTAVIAGGGTKQRRYMNCSGKHAGMLAACVAAGWPTTDYTDPNHPLQRAVAERLSALTSEPIAATGVDGCGAPVYAVSLTGLARGIGHVVQADPDSPEGRVAAAMRAHPELVAGTGRDDTRWMTGLPGLLSKGGAEGVHVLALPDGTALALKIADGQERGRAPLTAAALRWLGLTGPVVDELAAVPVLGGGRPVGVIEAIPGVLG